MIYTEAQLEALILPIMQDAKDNPQKATAAIINIIKQDREAHAANEQV